MTQTGTRREGWRASNHVRSSAADVDRVAMRRTSDVDEAGRRRVLVVEDDRSSGLSLRRHLERNGYVATVAETAEEGLGALIARPHRLVLLDWNLPHMSGAEFARALREMEEDVYTYIVVLTSSDDRGDMLRALDAGADDYMTKPFDGPELAARLQVAERILAFHEKMKVTERRLLELAERDGLTGVLNRRALDEKLRRALRDGCLGLGPVAYLMLDIDHFKAVNDVHGHQAGDLVLREVARRIGDGLREDDSVGRYGGEEFGILLPTTDSDGGRVVADRIAQSVREKPVETDAGPIRVTASVGLCSVSAGDDPSLLVARADQALYEAKARGRDRVVVWGEDGLGGQTTVGSGFPPASIASPT